MPQNEAPTAVVVITFLIFGFPVLLPLIKWMWLHPYVNKRKLKHNINEVSILQERLNAVEELLIDTDLRTMEKYNVRSKGITVTWSDSINGHEKTLTFFADGKTDTTRALKALAKAVEKETDKQLMKHIYRLPKRHGRGDEATVIRIHGLGED